MSNSISTPKPVLDAFPVLSDATFVKRLASPVPLVPDTTFDIFVTLSQDFLCLVTTDYPDPEHQSLELKSISGDYEFEFINLLKPGGKGDETVKILEHDDMDGDFLIYLPYAKYRLGYYVANVQVHSRRA